MIPKVWRGLISTSEGWERDAVYFPRTRVRYGTSNVYGKPTFLKQRYPSHRSQNPLYTQPTKRLLSKNDSTSNLFHSVAHI